ncbi:carboxymethylenebutenolidase [Collybia nuda]|uniref:Carboxymethylenebutenolidase n=1 Tax=Collybia nuda TaxID=64659 RepID=A0A9P5YHP9_9AGAR|nr:carboxymethylenebutenolidase [Collybia nuda]
MSSLSSFRLPRSLVLPQTGDKPLDPEPVQKWAEEGFAVIGVTASSPGFSLEHTLQKGIEALLSLKELDTNDKIAILVYDAKLVNAVARAIPNDPRLVCLILYGSGVTGPSTVPTLSHFPASVNKDTPSPLNPVHIYTSASPNFVLPHTAEYDPGNAALAHSRSLPFLRKWLGGPMFDLEAIWDEHCYFEFDVRSVAKTMGTMVEEPYVNHVPTMTGGIGRQRLTAFYRDHFIFSNPPDMGMQPVSRTVGSDRIVDEFIATLTHDRVIDWLLPGVPASGKKLAIPMIAVVNVRGDRLYNEHIWWDQATALRQAGVLPTHLPYPNSESSRMLRLPVAGVESANMLVDEANGISNEMFSSEWGVH